MSKVRSLTEGSIRGHLQRMTIPMVWGILAVIGKSVVDTFFVARLGTEPLTAIAFTFPVVLTVTSVAIGLGAGAASVVSRTIGEGDAQQVRRRATDALVLSALLMSVAAGIGLATIRPLFQALGAEGEVLELIHQYMAINFLAIPFLAIPMVGNALMRAAGDGKVPGILMIGLAVLNIGLDPILIFGLFGAPRLEIAGAAWAALIANATISVAVVAVLHFRERMIEWHIPELGDLKRSWAAVLHVGVPATLANMINPVGVALVTRMLADYGNEAVAAFGVATRVESIAVVGLFALSATIGPIVGQNWGARRGDRVRLALTRCYQYCFQYGLILAIAVAAMTPVIVSWFTDDPAVIELSRGYLWIVPITLFGYGINITGAAALNAVGKPLYSTGLTFARMGVIYIPLAALLGSFYGPWGVFVAAGVANLCSGVVTWWVTRKCLIQAPRMATQAS